MKNNNLTIGDIIFALFAYDFIKFVAEMIIALHG